MLDVVTEHEPRLRRRISGMMARVQHDATLHQLTTLLQDTDSRESFERAYQLVRKWPDDDPALTQTIIPRLQELLTAWSPDTLRPGSVRELSFADDRCTIKHPAFTLANSLTTELLNGDANTIKLANSPLLTSLISLSIYYNKIGPSGAKALANSPYIHNLRQLDIGYNKIGISGAIALLISPHLPQLTSLSLDANALKDAGAIKIAATTIAPHLTHFSLAHNKITTTGRAALLASTTLPDPIKAQLQAQPQDF